MAAAQKIVALRVRCKHCSGNGFSPGTKSPCMICHGTGYLDSTMEAPDPKWASLAADVAKMLSAAADPKPDKDK